MTEFQQVSPCMERAVLDQLSDYFKARLAGYPTSLSEDDALVMLNHGVLFCPGRATEVVFLISYTCQFATN